jgi:hypothetical protein
MDEVAIDLGVQNTWMKIGQLSRNRLDDASVLHNQAAVARL